MRILATLVLMVTVFFTQAFDSQKPSHHKTRADYTVSSNGDQVIILKRCKPSTEYYISKNGVQVPATKQEFDELMNPRPDRRYIPLSEQLKRITQANKPSSTTSKSIDDKTKHQEEQK